MCRLSSALVTLLICLSAWAPKARADDVLTTCQQLVEQKTKLELAKLSPFKLAFKLIFDREALIDTREVEHLEIVAPTSARDSEVTVFSLGREAPFTREDKAILKNISQQQKRTYSRIRTLLANSTAEECVATAKSIGWTPAELSDLQNQKTAALESYRHQESALANKMARKAIRKHPNWKRVAVNNWGEILQAMRTNPSAGMIVMAHADTDGRLYDSVRGEFPTSFFRSLPSSLNFIGVYSCESDLVTKAYGLTSLAGKEVVTVSLGAPFNVGATTPVMLLPIWTRELSKNNLLTTASPLLSGSSTSSKTESSQPEAECSLQLKNIHLNKGELSVSIAGKAIGVWSAENADQVQVFPCSLLTATPSLFMEPTHARLDPTQAVVEFNGDVNQAGIEALVTNGDQTITLKNAKVFTQDGFFRSVILK